MKIESYFKVNDDKNRIFIYLFISYSQFKKNVFSLYIYRKEWNNFAKSMSISLFLLTLAEINKLMAFTGS